jgi:hypothetical protein
MKPNVPVSGGTPSDQVAGSAICDNCGEPCSSYKEDSTLIAMVVGGDRKFRWGLDCSCGKRRWPNVGLTGEER